MKASLIYGDIAGQQKYPEIILFAKVEYSTLYVKNLNNLHLFTELAVMIS
ncbi:hypothetical protein [Desulfopila aestuarii]|nr:hypothetical protein [Desulfopila aestuarii]